MSSYVDQVLFYHSKTVFDGFSLNLT